MQQQPEDSPLAPAQLEHVWLEHIRFDQDAAFDRSDTPKVEYGVGYEVSASPHSHDDNGWFSEARMRAHISWSRLEAYDGPLPFELELELVALFAWEADPQDERAAISWIEYNTVTLLWPYLRQWVSLITSQGTVPPLSIYTLSVQSPAAFEAADFSDEVVRRDQAHG